MMLMMMNDVDVDADAILIFHIRMDRLEKFLGHFGLHTALNETKKKNQKKNPPCFFLFAHKIRYSVTFCFLNASNFMFLCVCDGVIEYVPPVYIKHTNDFFFYKYLRYVSEKSLLPNVYTVFFLLVPSFPNSYYIYIYIYIHTHESQYRNYLSNHKSSIIMNCES